MTGACGCEKFPLRKGGSAEGVGVVSRDRKTKDGGAIRDMR